MRINCLANGPPSDFLVKQSQLISFCQKIQGSAKEAPPCINVFDFDVVLEKILAKQERIPVGCVPAARRPYAGLCFRGGGCWGCLVWGVVCLVRGGLLPGWWCAWSGGGGGVPGLGGPGISACTEADTLPPVDRHTPVKTLPWPNFVAAGNNRLVSTLGVGTPVCKILNPSLNSSF